MNRWNTPWTDEQVKTLTAMWHDGKSARFIGQKVGATRNAVIGKAHRLGLKHPTPRNSHIEDRT